MITPLMLVDERALQRRRIVAELQHVISRGTMKPTLRLVVLAVFAAGLATGCKTQFVGEPKVPGGPQGCAARCSALGMELAGMVVMGEYSDGCICAVPGRAPATATSAFLYVGASGVLAAAAGVRMQMDDEEENQRRTGRSW